MEVKFKNGQLEGLARSMNVVANVPCKKLGYAVDRNRKVIGSLLNELESRKRISPSFAAENKSLLESFEKGRVELCEKWADKGEDGKPLMKDGEYVITGEGFKEELREKFPIVCEEIDKAHASYVSALNEEVTIMVHSIKFDDLPDSFSANMLNSISWMVEGM
jgi:hypothetical protein